MAAGTITRAVIAIISCVLIPLVVAQGGSQNGSPSDEPNLRAKGLVLVKIWCLIIVFVGTFAGGISPYFYRWNESFLLLGTQFAAGVFLGTAWMHFLGDSASTFADLTDKTYPFAFMLCTAGYLITMLADLIVAWVYQKQDGSNVTVISLQRKAESSVPTHTGETPLSLQVLPFWSERCFFKAYFCNFCWQNCKNFGIPFEIVEIHGYFEAAICQKVGG